MFQWLFNLLPQRREPTQEELELMEDCDPKRFGPLQRNYLKNLFPKEWTHFENFSQEEYLRVAVTLTMFGYTVDSQTSFIRALAMLVRQDIIETSEHDWLLRRA